MSLYKPEIIIVDEPFNGLDLVFRRRVFNSLIKCKEEGKTVLISTHDLKELMVMSDSITMLKKGVIVFDGRKDDKIEEIYEKVYFSGEKSNFGDATLF